MKLQIRIPIPFFLFILFFSCSKDNILTNDKKDKVSISKIESIKFYDVKVDTVFKTLDTIIQHFNHPQTELDYGDPLKKISDSINIDFNRANDSFDIKQNIYLPEIEVDFPQYLVLRSDSIKISSFPFNNEFISKSRYSSSTKYNGSIENIKIIFKYQRIYIKGLAKIKMIDNKGNRIWHDANISGSLVGYSSNETTVW